MSNNFLDAKKPKDDKGWIEYAILKFWEDCAPVDEHIADNAGDEIAELRAQLEEANGIISRMCLAIAYNKQSSSALIQAQNSAYEYLDKVNASES